MKGFKWNKTAIALTVTASLAIGLAGCDGITGKTDQEHVAAAKDFLDKDDLKSSVIELKGALQKNPENAEARRLLGEVNLDLGNGPAAEKELRRALELGVAIEAIVGSLAESLAIQGKYQEILDEIDAPSNLDPVEKAEIISYRGDAWLSKNKPEKAKAEYERALQADAESGAAKLGLAKLAVANKERAEAEKLIGEALKSSPEDSDIWFFLAELQKAKGEIDKAEESYGQAIKLNGRNLMARYQRALLRIGKKDFDAAEKDINVLKDKAPESFQRYYTEGLLAFYQKKFPEAEAALDQSIKLNGNFAQAAFYRGVAHLAQNHLAQAEKDLSRIQVAFPNAIKPRQLLAQVRFQKKEYREAKELLEPVIKFRPDDVFTLNLLGNIEFALGNNDQGMEYLQKLVELKPEDAGVHARLGMGMLKSGERAKGIQQLEKAGELAPTFTQGDVFIVMTHIQSKEYSKAQEVIERIKAKQPETPLAGSLTGMLFQAKGEIERAKEVYKTVLTSFSGNPAASHALASMALKDKDYVAVRKFYTDVLKKHPKHIRTKIRLAALDALENKPKQMEAHLMGAIEDNPQALQPRLILARFYTRFGQPGRAQTLLEEMKPQYGKSPQLLTALYEAQLVDNNRIRALETAKELSRAAPQSAQAWFVLANAYEANNDFESMRTALKRSLDLDPSNVKAMIATIKLLILDGNMEKAEKSLSVLVSNYPENINIKALQGWVAEHSDKPNLAIQYYQNAFDKQPSTKRVMDLAKANWGAGKELNAVALLEEWAKGHAEDAAAHYTLARYQSSLGNEEESISELNKVLKLAPNNVFALNDLAWKIRKAEPIKALEYAEKAYGLAQNVPPVIDTLAMILLENRQNERALSLLEEAERKAPGSAIIKYHLAIAMKSNGQAETAIEKLTDLLIENDKFKGRSEAERRLKKWVK